jgi:excinuclease ABC subunit B
MDNRPLKFDEFETMVNQTIYVSATPADFELQQCEGVMVEQVIRPTGLLDPFVEVRPSLRQIDDLMEEINQRIHKNERTLVTTLTKRMAEELTSYFTKVGILCRYIHADVDTLERVEILRDLRLGRFDVLVGVNLLREGLDLPEVSLVAILDADKEGFLRSERSLTQTAGRAARNINSRVIMYADKLTESMKRMMNETNRRREKQIRYNALHNITPAQIVKSMSEILGQTTVADGKSHTPAAYVEKEYSDIAADPIIQYLSKEKLQKLQSKNRKAMDEAVKSLDFLEAARLRDELKIINEYLERQTFQGKQNDRAGR